MFKNKKKKGFTLIELIVVIAILGILAAIAIPRFSGFNDKAKIAADKELANIVQRSMSTLIAGGEVDDVAGTVTLSNTGAYTTTFTAAQIRGTGADAAAEITSLLNPLVGTDTKLVKYTSIVVNRNATGGWDAVTYNN